jgi:hypothetical protein
MTLHRATGRLPVLAHCVAALNGTQDLTNGGSPFINSGLVRSLLSAFTVPERISIEDIEASGSQLQ